jgi:hypothetical protein
MCADCNIKILVVPPIRQVLAIERSGTTTWITILSKRKHNSGTTSRTREKNVFKQQGAYLE